MASRTATGDIEAGAQALATHRQLHREPHGFTGFFDREIANRRHDQSLPKLEDVCELELRIASLVDPVAVTRTRTTIPLSVSMNSVGSIRTAVKASRAAVIQAIMLPLPRVGA